MCPGRWMATLLCSSWICGQSARRGIVRFLMASLAALLGLVAGGCDGSDTGAGEKIAPVTGPDAIWILEVPNPIVWEMEHPETYRIRTAPDGEPMRVRFWCAGREENASEVVLVMRARPMPPSPDGAMASGLWFDHNVDSLAYRATELVHATATGPWREFRRLEGDEAAEAFRAASEDRRKDR